MRNILQFLVGLVCLCSCEGILDEQIPEHNTVDGNVITDENSVEVALVGVYSYLQGGDWEYYYLESFANLAGTYWGTRRAMISSQTEGAGYDYELIDNAFTYDNSYILNQWQGAYNMILAANWVIDRIEPVHDNKFKGNRKKEIVAEARFMRFFGHYYLFRLFCKFWDTESSEGLLYREAPVSVSSHVAPRLNVAESYEKLLADLDYVIDNGPDFKDAYHASRDAAKAFKAELLMMRGKNTDFAEVITLTEELIAKYPLENTLTDLYGKGASASEVIFARFQSQKDTWSTPEMKNFCYGDMYGFLPSALLNLIQGDSGYFDWYQSDIICYSPQGIPQTYHNSVKKMAPTGKTNEEIKATTKVFYMRAAELYLLKAEAIARTTGNTTAVRTLINDNLYSRAGHPDIPDQPYSKELLLNEVYKAYLLELALENGIEYPVAVRFIDPLTNMRYLIGQKRNLSTEADMWKTIQPIPKEEVRVNTSILQNEGYPKN